MYKIGIDIGGTFVKGGIVKNGKIIARDKVPSVKTSDKKEILNCIKGLIDSLLVCAKLNPKDISGIGIGMAGSCDKGVCLFMPNLGWRNIPFKKHFEKVYGCKVEVVNDLKAATLGELNYGYGKKYKDFVFVGLGTGLNIGVVKNGQYIVEGVEFGHIIVSNDGPVCGCGKKGCLETLVSTKALLRNAKKYDKNSPDNVKELFESAKQNRDSKKAIDEYLENLNIGLMNICNCYRPKAIIIGGGIGEALRDGYINDVNKMLKQSSYGYPTAKHSQVFCSKVGNNCGILGSSSL